MNNTHTTNNGTAIGDSTLKYGRRETDKMLGIILEAGLAALNKQRTPIIVHTEQTLQGTERSKTRRPRRTKAQLREALKRGVERVRSIHPEWRAPRIKRAARSLVRRYHV